MKQYKIFNGKRIVEVNKDLVDIFEQIQGPLTDVYVEIIMVGDNLDKNTPQEILNKTLFDALIEEVQVVSQINSTFPDFLEEMGIE